ncbi:MAG: LCCL domain-containing protein [Rhodanobacter sp.]
MTHALTRTAVTLLLIAQLAGCQHGEAAAPLPALDWHTSPLDLNLRGMNGKTYLFRCPAGKPTPAAVTGSGVYTDASSICAAAVHAGEIDSTRGGLVMIQILPGQSDYRGTMQNFIPSQAYTQAWGGSFAVLSPSEFHAERPR